MTPTQLKQLDPQWYDALMQVDPRCIHLVACVRCERPFAFREWPPGEPRKPWSPVAIQFDAAEHWRTFCYECSTALGSRGAMEQYVQEQLAPAA